ncbi:MAG TPA: hypothetical protein VIG24_02645 [Acidimicrobiia bacterium]
MSMMPPIGPFAPNQETAPRGTKAVGMPKFRAAAQQGAPQPTQQSGQFGDIAGVSVPGQGGLADQPSLIGGFHRYGDPDLPPVGPGGELQGPWSRDIVNSVYYEGDDAAILRGMNTEDFARLQDNLASLGILTGHIPGERDDRTLSTFRQVLTLSNRSGTPWQQTLQRLSTNPALADEMSGFTSRPYMAPDYASLAEEVRATMQRRLGRDPDEAEMAELVGNLQGWDRQAFQAEEQARRMAHRGEGGTVSGVDPSARFQQMFEGKYRGELDIVDERGDHSETRGAMQQTVQLLRGMVNR